MIAAIIFKSYRGISGTKLANELTTKCYNKGLLLVNTGRESIKLGPPLIITKSSLIRAIQILNTSIKELKWYE